MTITDKKVINDELNNKLSIEEVAKQQYKVEAHMKALQQIREQAFKIEIEVLDGGKIPAKANRTDAGFDVYATDDVVIYPGQVVKHPLNIKMKLPASSWARIETKSGLGSQGMLVYAGVVDEGYRGIPHVIATNLMVTSEDNNGNVVFNETAIVIKKGSKIAQITMNPHSNEYFMVQVDKVDTNTDRGEGGFGSSGTI